MINKLIISTILLIVLFNTSLLAQPLSIPELVDLAFKNNPETQMAWWNAKRAADQREAARATYYPHLRLQGKLDNGRQYRFPKGNEVTYTMYGADLYLSYLLLDCGERSAANEAAAAALIAAGWQSNFMLQKVLHTVLANTYAYLNAQEVLDSRMASLNDAKKTLEVTDQLYQAGVRSINDLYAIRTTVAEMQMTLAWQRAEVDIAKGRLATSLGLGITQSLEVQPLPDPVLTNQMFESLPQLLERANDLRADLMAKRAEVCQKNAIIGQASAAASPKLRFNAKGGYERYDHDKTNGADYKVGLSLDIPLFNGFENVYQTRVAYADAQASQADLQRLEADIAFDVLKYSRECEAAKESLQWAQDYLQNGIKTFEGILEKYKAGTQSIFDLMNAQRQLAEARIKHGEAKTRWYRSLAQLAYATGTMEDLCTP